MDAPKEGAKQLVSRLKFGSDRGQSLVTVLLILPVLLGMAALVIDGGNAFAEKRRMQNAVDAAALAAAQEVGPALVACDSACMDAVRSKVAAAATDYGRKNHWSGPPGTLPECTEPADSDDPDTDCYTWPYNGSNAKVEVRLAKDVDTVLAGIFAGVIPLFDPSSFTARARAVAGATGGTAMACIFPENEDADPDNDVANPNQYLNTDPPCTIPAQPEQTGTYHAAEPDHCLFPGADPPVEDPDQYLNTTPPCTGPNTGGVDGAIALVMSRECDAISYTGAGGGSIGSLVTNGGIWFQGSQPKRVHRLAYEPLGCPTHPNSPPSGTSECTDPANAGNLLCVKELLDFSDRMPMNWPVPPPPEPTPLPFGTWDPSTHYPSSCTDLGTGDVTFTPADGPPGIYCLRGGARLTVNGDFSDGDGYTFFALGGGRIQVSSNGTNVKFYWPSACGGRPTDRPMTFTCFGRTISGYDPQTLFYATNTVHDAVNCANNAICVNGSTATLAGDLFAVLPGVFPPPDRSPRP